MENNSNLLKKSHESIDAFFTFRFENKSSIRSVEKKIDKKS